MKVFYDLKKEIFRCSLDEQDIDSVKECPLEASIQNDSGLKRQFVLSVLEEQGYRLCITYFPAILI